MIEKMLNDRTLRINLATNSHFWFFHCYFRGYVNYRTADFQKEIFQITEDDKQKLAVIVAFRGSAKSTLITLSYAIWSILGRQEKKFVVIFSQTQYQVKLHLANIKRELETNELLKSELGPFEEKNEEWGSASLVLPKFNARITAASNDQGVRGLRHGPYRPDLIIADDVENLASNQTLESRNKNYQWFTSEVLPIGDLNTKVVVVGNLLHKDSLLMRLKSDIEEKRRQGTFQAYPLMRDKKILWPGKFPDLETVKKAKSIIGDDIAWNRECLLRIIPNVGQIIHDSWIHKYDKIKEGPEQHLFTATGIDLAISKKESADYTAMVSAKVYRDSQGNIKIYILPNPINERLSFPETIKKVKALQAAIGPGKIYVEDVAYQASLHQQLREEGIYAEGVKVNGQDKISRLNLIAPLLQSGKILFPEKGAEKLISQILGFGIEKHDDLVDAFTLLVLKINEETSKQPPEIIFI